MSHYIDNEIKQVKEVVTEKYSKMKSIFTKLAEQLKEHLLKTEQNRKSTEGRLTAIEEDFDKLKNEVNGEIDEFYNDLEARLKEEKEFLRKINTYIRIMTPQDLEQFSADLLTELRCRLRIQQLQNWRRNGITTQEDGLKYEKDKLIRQAHYQRLGNSSGLASRTLASHSLSNGVRKILTPQPDYKPKLYLNNSQ